MFVELVTLDAASSVDEVESPDSVVLIVEITGLKWIVGELPSGTVTTDVNCSSWLRAWSNDDGTAGRVIHEDVDRGVGVT